MELVLIAIVVVAVIAGLWGIGVYNGFVKARNLIQESWRQIDVELNRRYDLIPNLVETVRGYAAHERNTLEQVTNLRNSAAQLANQAHGEPSQQRAALESELSQAVHNLIVSVEAYPELKSNVNFLELQRELTDTEDRIAAGRRFYNANVRDYNTKIETVPSNIIAGMAKMERATYFEVQDPQVRQRPSVNFGEISQRPQEQDHGQITGGQPQQGPYQVPPPQQQSPAPQYQNHPQQQPHHQQSAPPQQPYQQGSPQQPPQQGGYQPPFTN